MRILVVDGQGGGVGRQLAAQIKETFPDVQLMAVGTNTIATSAMLKGGADTAATGENAVLVAARKADVIVGPLGIVVADVQKLRKRDRRRVRLHAGTSDPAGDRRIAEDHRLIFRQFMI